MAKYTCFVISPIGQPGSEKRRKADDVFDLIIEAALEKFDFDVWRADHKYTSTDIVEEMVNDIQTSDLCVIDMTDLNPNVMYEFGRRHETGKPFITLIDKNQLDTLPFDTASIRTIAYDPEFPGRATRDTISIIQNMVETLIESGLESSTRASLNSIADALNRMERKLESILRQGAAAGPRSVASPVNLGGGLPAGSDPNEVFRYAIRNRDIALIDQCLDRVRQTMSDEIQFYDYYVELAASRGSEKAGTMMKEFMDVFMANASSFKMKVEYISYYVTYCNIKDKELAEYDFVFSMLDALIEEGVRGHEEARNTASLYCQKNRMCYGCYAADHNPQWLHDAVGYLKQSIEIYPDDASYYYNLATCFWQLDDMDSAEKYISQCLEIDAAQGDDDGDDVDHLNLACKIYLKTNHPDLHVCSEKLRNLDPIKWSNLFQR